MNNLFEAALQAYQMMYSRCGSSAEHRDKLDASDTNVDFVLSGSHAQSRSISLPAAR